MKVGLIFECSDKYYHDNLENTNKVYATIKQNDGRDHVVIGNIISLPSYINSDTLDIGLQTWTNGFNACLHEVLGKTDKDVM